MASLNAFAHARDFRIDTQNINVSHQCNGGHGKAPLEFLLEHVAHGALHDSAERGGPDAPKCHPETRTAIQQEINSWIKHGERDANPKKILWLSGPAGCGKTAIAGTIADECHKQGLLAASFFFSAFSPSANRRSKQPLIPTLAYGLLQHEAIAGYKDEVAAVINKDPLIFNRHLDGQLEALVLAPLRRVVGRSVPPTWPKVIIIDGLDECDAEQHTETSQQGIRKSREDNHLEVLSILKHASSDPSFPFRIIIVSRPDPAIRDFFSTAPFLTLKLFLDDRYNPDADIALFLKAKFSDIRRRFNLPASWASDDVVKLLVKAASGQFIYVATVIRFIESTAKPPAEQLRRILQWRHVKGSQPFAALDALYTHIFATSPDPPLTAKWCMVINSHGGNGYYLKGLLESYPGETQFLLGRLSSLIGISYDGDGDPSFHFYHKSLIDFLNDPSRSASLHGADQDRGQFIRDRFYQTLKNRGPQGGSLQSSAQLSTFLQHFCSLLSAFIDPNRKYEPADINWWLAHLLSSDKDWCLPFMFERMHRDCHWSHCLPACKLWRKGILQCCRANGWRLPTKLEMVRDRFEKYEFDYGQRDAFPLHHLR